LTKAFSITSIHSCSLSRFYGRVFLLPEIIKKDSKPDGADNGFHKGIFLRKIVIRNKQIVTGTLLFDDE
jgi:hypothetical protein